MSKPFNVEDYAIPDDQVGMWQARMAEARARKAAHVTPKRAKCFVMVPWRWHEKLVGATGQTYRLAQLLLYLHWKDRGAPIRLANKTLEADGISRQSKWRALRELEQRGLIVVECRSKKSPLVRVFP